MNQRINWEGFSTTAVEFPERWALAGLLLFLIIFIALHHEAREKDARSL